MQIHLPKAVCSKWKFLSGKQGHRYSHYIKKTLIAFLKNNGNSCCVVRFVMLFSPIRKEMNLSLKKCGEALLWCLLVKGVK